MPQFSSVSSSGYDEVVITKDSPAYQNSACADLTKPVCFVRVAVHLLESLERGHGVTEL